MRQASACMERRFVKSGTHLICLFSHVTCDIKAGLTVIQAHAAGSRVPVVAPQDRRVIELELILIANPNYVGEITSLLKSLGYRGQLQILR